MPHLIKISDDLPLSDVVVKVLDRIESNDEPETIQDSIVGCGVMNRIRVQAVRAKIMAALKPDGSHFYLTENKKWSRDATTRWAADLDLPLGKNVVPFVSRIDSVEAMREDIAADPMVPEDFKHSTDTLARIINDRAGRKWDQRSADNVAEVQRAQAASVVAALETLRRQHAEDMLRLVQEQNRVLARQLGDRRSQSEAAE